MENDRHTRRVSSKSARLFQLFTLCFTLAVALACTGNPFGSSGSSGGKKKKKDRNPPAFVIAGKDAVASPSSADSDGARSDATPAGSRLADE